MLAWLRKAERGVVELEPTVRLALEGALRRWRQRADDVFTDWAELLTDPVALADAVVWRAPASVKKRLNPRGLFRYDARLDSWV